MNKKFAKKYAAIASITTICIASAYGAWGYFTPYTYVSLDVNPSIEYSVNRFDTVIDVKAVNEDGEAILSQIDLKELENKSIEEALSSTVDTIAENGYFSGTTDGGIVISTSSADSEKSEELANTLKETVEAQVEEKVADNEVVVEAFSVAKERVEEAKTLGVTPGKLNLVQKLIESSKETRDISKEEWLNKPVKEIMKAIKQNNKAARITATEETQLDDDNQNGNEDISDMKNETLDNEDDADKEEISDDTENSEDQEYEDIQDNDDNQDDADDQDDNDKEVKEQEKNAELAKKKAERKSEIAKKEAEKKSEKYKKEAERKSEIAKKEAERAKEAAEKAREDAKESYEKAKEDSEYDNQDSEYHNSNDDEQSDDNSDNFSADDED
ncbi:hypothetical protein bsdtb5_34130 [Anaeromicropila herbilytica]|uniref:Anti-sigma factor RsgI-like middle domain-containing protein n=2 Tax=Anaeromicropila herbilytica TaxID=2785025 RepID=A0A7R7IDV8_9FIRM|nr:hypothetical protein bsdtb5_34130 [Anaeromicropila herbilytica]